MRTLLLICTLWVSSLGKPNGYYHQEYNYKASAAAYRNNELQQRHDHEGYYSKDGDLEGRVRPRVNSHNQQSEYINPKLQHSYQMGDGGSSYGQLHAAHEMDGSYGYMNVHGGQNYGVQSNLRQITANIQEELTRQLQRAVYDHYQRAAAYGGAISQAQIEADMRALEEEIRRNVTVRLQEALKTHYGNEGIRGGYSYTILDGRLQPTANYHSQELAELTRQMEAHLMHQLQEQMQTYYHTTVDTEVHTRRNTYRRVNGNGYAPPSPIQQRPPPPQMYPLPHPQPHPPQQPHPQPGHTVIIPHVPDSITTIATRVQTELNEHLNRILEDIQKRYFSTNSYHNLNNYNFDQILAQLQEELRANITFHFDDQMKRAYGFSNYASKYSVEDVENYRRQIEHNLISRLVTSFNRQREQFYQTHMPNGPVPPMYQPIPANHAYYPVSPVNPVHPFHYQGEVANIQRQLQETMSRQLQTALMQQAYRQANMYTGGPGFNPEAHYQETLSRLTAELNRNLTRQMEMVYRNQNLQHSGTYQAQLANMRNQLQQDLMRQLHQGLQQSYSRYNSWSSASSTSSRAGSVNYRPVRGFDPNLYRNYGGEMAMMGPGEDCMMGDDPSAAGSRKKRSIDDQDLTQQAQTLEDDDLTQIVGDIDEQDFTRPAQTHQAQQIQSHDDLTQQVQSHDDLTQQVQSHDDLTQQVQSHDDLTQQVQTPNEDLTQQQVQIYQKPSHQQVRNENLLNQAHDLTQPQRNYVESTTPKTYYHPNSYVYHRPGHYYGRPSDYRGIVNERVRYYENMNRPYQPSTYFTHHHVGPIIPQVQPGFSHHYHTPNQRPILQPLAQHSMTPQSGNMMYQYPSQSQSTFQEPLGQQVEDFTQQTQTGPGSGSLDRYSLQKPAPTVQQPLGQQVEDSDLTQQTETFDGLPPKPAPIQQQPLGQQVQNTDFTQQTLNEPQVNDQYRQPKRLLGQVEDSDLTQQTEDVGFGQTQQNLGQQTEVDSFKPSGGHYVTQPPRTVVSQDAPPIAYFYRRPRPGLSHIRTTYGGTPQQTQVASRDEPSSLHYVPWDQHRADLNRQPIRHQVDTFGNTQQVENDDFAKFSQQDLNQQQSQQVENFGLTQQTEDDDFAKFTQQTNQQLTPQNQIRQPLTPLHRYTFPQQTDNLGQQQTEDDEFTEPFIPQNQQQSQQFSMNQPRQPLTQQTDDLAQQQTEDDDFTKPFIPQNQQQRQPLTPQNQQRQPFTQPSFPPQTDDLGQQQTVDDEFVEPFTPQNQHRQPLVPQNQQRQPLAQYNQHSYPQQTDDLGQQQTEDDDFTPQNQQQRQPLTPQNQQRQPLAQYNQHYYPQQTDDLGQQTVDDEFVEPFTPQNQHRQPLTPQNQQRQPLAQYNQPSYPQQTDDLGQQQTEDDDFTEQFTPQNQHRQPLTPQNQQRQPLTHTFPQQTDDLDQQQTMDEDFLQPLTPQNQRREPLAQQIDQLGQQTEDDDFAKLTQQELSHTTDRLTPQNQEREQLTQQVEDLTQQTEDDDFAKLTQQQSQVEEIEQPVEPQLTQTIDNSQQSRQQTQDLIQQEIDQNLRRVEEPRTTVGSGQNQAIENEIQRLIDQLRQLQRNQPSTTTGRRGYYDPSQYESGYHQTQVPGGRSLINENEPPKVNYASTVEEDEAHTETVEEIETVQPQKANEVQVVDNKGHQPEVETVKPEEAVVISTTTAKPSWWKRFGSSISNKYNEYKEKIG